METKKCSQNTSKTCESVHDKHVLTMHISISIIDRKGSCVCH